MQKNKHIFQFFMNLSLSYFFRVKPRMILKKKSKGMEMTTMKMKRRRSRRLRAQ